MALAKDGGNTSTVKMNKMTAKVPSTKAVARAFLFRQV